MNTAESAFIDELEKISGVRDSAKAVLDRIRRKLGNRVIGAGKRIRGEHELIQKAKTLKPWLIGAGGIGGGAGLAYYLNKESENA